MSGSLMTQAYPSCAAMFSCHFFWSALTLPVLVLTSIDKNLPFRIPMMSADPTIKPNVTQRPFLSSSLPVLFRKFRTPCLDKIKRHLFWSSVSANLEYS